MSLKVLIGACACVAALIEGTEKLASAGGKAPVASFAKVSLHVAGDVAVRLVDQRGRETGWQGHKFEAIPRCSLEVIDDEVAEPIEYTFRFHDGGNASYLLVLSPRTEGDVEISVSAIVHKLKGCKVSRSGTLVDGREYRYQVRWSAIGDSCGAEVAEIHEQGGKKTAK